MIGLPPNSSLQWRLTDSMLKLSDSGQLTALARTWLVDTSQCPDISSSVTTTLGINQFYGYGGRGGAHGGRAGGDS